MRQNPWSTVAVRIRTPQGQAFVDYSLTMVGRTSGALKRILRPMIPKSILRMRELRKIAAERGLELIKRDLFYDLKRADTILRVRSSHFFYLAHMIQSFDVYTKSVIPLQFEGTSIIDMSGPRFHRLKGFGSIPFLFPSHAEPYETTAEYLDFAELKGGEIVLDIGAYSAVTSIIFAQIVGAGGHVYAFEPDEVNFDCARVNVEMAESVLSLSNITLINKAVWSHNDGVLFSHEGAMGSSAVAITGHGRGLEQHVPTIRLEDFAATFGLRRLDFVKVDIEGGEIELLSSSAGFLKETGARLIVEPHFVDGALSTDRCKSLLESAGYRVNVRAKVGESEPLIEATP